MPGKAFESAGMVATNVLPSPVSSSAIAPIVDCDTAHHLDVKVPLTDRPLGGLTDQGESLDQQAVERVALASPAGAGRVPCS